MPPGRNPTGGQHQFSQPSFNYAINHLHVTKMHSAHTLPPRWPWVPVCFVACAALGSSLLLCVMLSLLILSVVKALLVPSFFLDSRICINPLMLFDRCVPPLHAEFNTLNHSHKTLADRSFGYFDVMIHRQPTGRRPQTPIPHSNRSQDSDCPSQLSVLRQRRSDWVGCHKASVYRAPPYLCVFAHTRMRVCVHVCVCVRMCVFVCARACAHGCAYVCTCMYTYMLCSHVHVCVRARARARARVCTRVRPRMNVYIYKLICITGSTGGWLLLTLLALMDGTGTLCINVNQRHTDIYESLQTSMNVYNNL